MKRVLHGACGGVRLLPLILIASLVLSSGRANGAELVVWNVGQGQWATWIDERACLHFDTGGEFAPLERIRAACGERLNFAVYSHWDWDHVGLIRRAARELPHFCILKKPAGPAKQRALALFKGITACDESRSARSRAVVPIGLNEVSATASSLPHRSGRSRSGRGSNSESRVFEVATRALIPGDSPSGQEKLWLHRLVARERIRWLLLGHHGSRTSTSSLLLSQLPGLKQAIASARRERYGHPHAQVLKRLRKKGIAALRTEEWGSIHFELRDRKPRMQFKDKKAGAHSSECKLRLQNEFC